MEKECINCYKIFKAKRSNRKFCSKDCFYDFMSDKTVISCKTCGTKINVQSKQASKRKYCSQACYQTPRLIDYSCPKRRISATMSTSIHMALKHNKAGMKWEYLVGYSVGELKIHLESMFKDGMSWDNYGEWHIDHIIPKSVFNYKKPNHIAFKKCWGLENLQPLWAKENYIKSNKLIKPHQKNLAL